MHTSFLIATFIFVRASAITLLPETFYPPQRKRRCAQYTAALFSSHQLQNQTVSRLLVQNVSKVLGSSFTCQSFANKLSIFNTMITKWRQRVSLKNNIFYNTLVFRTKFSSIRSKIEKVTSVTAVATFVHKQNNAGRVWFMRERSS